MLDRVTHGLRRHGVAGSARIAARKLLADPSYDATHVWYALELSEYHPQRVLGPGLVLERGSEADAERVEQLPRDPAILPVDRAEAVRRLRGGAELWLVAEGPRIAFACWIFHGRTPVHGARGGTLELPGDVVCLEDSHASPDFRGRGIAPAAWSGIAQACSAAGFTAMVTKVREENTASRSAVEKAGFRAVAVMRTHRTRLGTRIEVTLEPPGRQAWLRSLERSR